MTRVLAVLLTIQICVIACSGTQDAARGRQDSPFATHKAPLRDEEYGYSIRFVSETELEWTMRKGAILAWHYTVQTDGSLRITASAMGDSSVIYLQKTADGYSGQLGNALLFGSPKTVTFR